MSIDLPPPVDDGLVTPEVGSWSKDKHHFLWRYLSIFSTGMKNKWPERHYIDLFSSAGILKIKDTGELIWGSPLLAAQVTDRFSGLHFFDLDKDRVNALRVRLREYPQPSEPQVRHGDANTVVAELLREIPPSALSVTFLDPYGLSLHFETLKALSQLRTDLIIFFPDHLDVLRNWWHVYKDQPNSRLDRVLGTDIWQSIFEYPRSQWADQLRRLYEQQIETLGYQHFEYERIHNAHGRQLYLLIYCSKDERGADFWRKASRMSRDQQSRFW